MNLTKECSSSRKLPGKVFVFQLQATVLYIYLLPISLIFQHSFARLLRRFFKRNYKLFNPMFVSLIIWHNKPFFTYPLNPNFQQIILYSNLSFWIKEIGRDSIRYNKFNSLSPFAKGGNWFLSSIFLFSSVAKKFV